VTVDGPGGPLTFHPFLVPPRGMDALGFRVNGVATCRRWRKHPRPYLASNLGRAALPGSWMPFDASRNRPTAIWHKLSDWIEQVKRDNRRAERTCSNDLDYRTPRRRDPRPHQPRLRRRCAGFPLD